MKFFDMLKKRSYSDVFALGLRYSTDKLEFEKFAPQAWGIANGDYLRAVVATAHLLNNEVEGKAHFLHVLDFVYGNINGDGHALLEPIFYFFDDDEGKLTKVYKEYLADYQEVEKMFDQLQEIEFSQFVPLIKSTDFYKLMSYNNKKVLVSTLNENKEVKTQLSTLRLLGTHKENPSVCCGGQISKLFGLNSGIMAIRDPETYHMLFQNVYVDNDNLSELQKTGFIFGRKEARKIYAQKREQVNSKQLMVEPRRRNLKEFFGESCIGEE